tara:strand:+ start:293 stop:1642 length:1350 start_codon:yes stop_codon:yes gene_type:complete
MKIKLREYFQSTRGAEPLAVFRIGFGLMMLYSIMRFYFMGWIDKVYVKPNFHFKYYGFEWIPELGEYTYILFVLCALASITIALGFKYRISIILFFLSFTYIELLEKTVYLNHYYFISILSFLLIFLPLNASFSIDNLIRNTKKMSVPSWKIDCIKLLLAIVYIYAGIAKINYDWLIDAMPLKLWLTSKYDLPIIGEYFMQQVWVHYLMSWGGMIYDLTIPFLLIYKRTRNLAFFMVVAFHVFTRILFPIGVFPYVMIISALIFFDNSFHEKVINYLKKIIFAISNYKIDKIKNEVKYTTNKSVLFIVCVFFAIQISLPLRSVFYPGNIMWHEQGYRFSWRVMLMEKIGYTTFKIEKEDGKYFYVDNQDHLTSYQEKQMSFQPDFILEYAHYLGRYYNQQGLKNIKVFAESYVSLNGRKSQKYIDPNINLLEVEESFKNKTWIMPQKYD